MHNDLAMWGFQGAPNLLRTKKKNTRLLLVTGHQRL